eukprot:SAG31_NODE_32769_length_352_cov_0.521739_2_plen_33_part_01
MPRKGVIGHDIVFDQIHRQVTSNALLSCFSWAS